MLHCLSTTRLAWKAEMCGVVGMLLFLCNVKCDVGGGLRNDVAFLCK